MGKGWFRRKKDGLEGTRWEKKDKDMREGREKDRKGTGGGRKERGIMVG